MASAFELEQFIADCRVALDADPSHKLVREVVARAVADPGKPLLRGRKHRRDRCEVDASPGHLLLGVPAQDPMFNGLCHSIP
jgi:hypothetical protein